MSSKLRRSDVSFYDHDIVAHMKLAKTVRVVSQQLVSQLEAGEGEQHDGRWLAIR